MINKSGVVLIDKPLGESSFKQISKLRKILNMRKIGHCGTLDPLATGLLVLCLNKATKIVEILMNGDKEYIATVSFGSSTTTDDKEGETLKKSDKKVSELELRNVLQQFKGEIYQIPPNFSAVKINGKRAYSLARNNQKFEISKRKVYINTIDLVYFNENEQLAELKINCSKGTYIRSIARDVGEVLGSYAHLASLIRTKSGSFSVDSPNVISDLDSVEADDVWTKLISISDSLSNIKYLRVVSDSEKKIPFGQKLFE